MMNQRSGGADWDFINIKIEEMRDKDEYYKIFVSDIIYLTFKGSAWNYHHYQLYDDGTVIQNETIEHNTIVKILNSHVSNTYGFMLSTNIANSNEILYSAYYQFDTDNQSEYDYRTARKAYDSAKETKKMYPFWIYDLNLNYLSL